MEIRSKNLRVYLKSLEYGDAEEMAKNANNDEVAFYIGRPGEFPHPYTKEDASLFIADAARAYAEKSAFHFGIFLNDGTLVGVCGIHTIYYNDLRGEIGYWLGRPYWGKGYAKEATVFAAGVLLQPSATEQGLCGCACIQRTIDTVAALIEFLKRRRAEAEHAARRRVRR